MDLYLKDRVAIVTGAGRGICRTVARTFAEEGANVVVADVLEEQGSQVAEELKTLGSQAVFVRTDVSMRQDTDRMAKVALDTFGRIDILVNGAGRWSTAKFFWDTEEEDWDIAIRVCLYGTYNCTRSVIKTMMDQKYGRIVSIASDGARSGEPRQCAYQGAKAGIIGFSMSLAKELGRHGVTVNCISPGMTNVEHTRATIESQDKIKGPGASDAMLKKILSFYPLGKLGEPQDVANAVVLLASDRAGHITGQTLSVNGGYFMSA